MSTEDTAELDKYIARYVGIRSPREIAELSGTTARDVIRRAEEMKDEVDALSIEAQISFTLRSLNEIAADAKTDAANSTDNRDKAGLYSAAVSAHAQSLKQLAALKKENDGAVAELNRKRLTAILHMFDIIVSRGVGEISEKYGIQEGELLELFQGHISTAAAEVEGQTVAPTKPMIR